MVLVLPAVTDRVDLTTFDLLLVLLFWLTLLLLLVEIVEPEFVVVLAAMTQNLDVFSNLRVVVVVVVVDEAVFCPCCCCGI